MSSSIQSLTASSLGAMGSVFITGTAAYNFSTKVPIAFRTVDTDTVIAGITGSAHSGISYLVGKTLTNYEFLGPFTDIRLSAGALQAFY